MASAVKNTTDNVADVVRSVARPKEEETVVDEFAKFMATNTGSWGIVPGVSTLTRAYALPTKTIMHTIVPKWGDDDPQRCYEELCKSYVSALTLADEAGFKSIAFPVLVSGNNGFDPDLAIDIAVESISRYQPKNLLYEAHLVTFDSGITQRIRNRGYQVEEVIDQMRVLDQDVHQAQVVKGSEH